MLTRITGGRVVDPVHGRDGIGDVWIRDERIVPPGEAPDRTIDAAGCIVMAGAIDVHSHIAGGNVVLSRLLLPEFHAEEAPLGDIRGTSGSAAEIGAAYARMGYTTVIEPAMPPVAALATHLELAEVPVIDRAGLTVMGNDDQLLALLRAGESANAVRDLVALTLATSRGLGLKVINAGGAAAFKDGASRFALDDEVPSYGLTSRRILSALLDAVETLGVPHPLHVHCSNLGLAGADDSLVATVEAAEGRRMHLAHAQFYAYAARPEGGFSSAAERICETLARHPNVTLDVGQVSFGQTCTISLDIGRQFTGRTGARPRRWALVAGDAEGGGLVPFAYRRANPTSCLQFAIGLEIMLLSPDPSRTLLTTDHPNGGPFTAYPRILHLLMDKAERDREIAGLDPVIAARTALPGIEREYSLSDVAAMTRAGPARLLGLSDRGHLGPGARADVAVYRDDPDRTAMFAAARFVLKDGAIVVEDGRLVARPAGRTLALGIETDHAMRGRADAYLEGRYGRGLDGFAVPDAAFAGREVFAAAPSGVRHG
ncbi:formylmethanofuran dehydrogenase subunit A [Salinarimonas soli]|uniref:Formylmethanofuran dehydrogenase subunit A n=1 Tax=Salinarimonas soli TaxID=1638099 RepID=A0A5B2VH42_9HYPH|nr:formylmethanofuran dehydrogenase subunit A [Salinarimonas soli]KAA2237497.1 formylmethanofuran dehydrogenase subunit A [Salinarimonas soli]